MTGRLRARLTVGRPDDRDGPYLFSAVLIVRGSDHAIEISMSRLPALQREFRSRANLLAMFVVEPDETGPITATHLEQVFAKLSVETRTAAALRATEVLKGA